jgi:hypothetical protein
MLTAQTEGDKTPIERRWFLMGSSPRCPSTSGVTRVELSLENLDQNPRPARPNPRTARHLH